MVIDPQDKPSASYTKRSVGKYKMQLTTDSHIWRFHYKLTVPEERLGSAGLPNTGAGRITTTAVLQTPAGLNVVGASKPRIWVLQSHYYLSYELLLTCTICEPFLSTARSCTGTEVWLHSFLISALKEVSSQPLAPQFHHRGYSPPPLITIC